MRLEDVVGNLEDLRRHWQDCPRECDVNSCPRLVGIPRASFDPNCETCVNMGGSHLREIIHGVGGAHTLIGLDGGEVTLTPASPSSEDILGSDDTLEEVDWIVKKGSAAPEGLDPGRMGRLEDDQHQVIKLWAGVLQCGLRLEARVPLAMLLPQLAAGGYTFREDVDLAQTLKRWDSRLLITDDVLSIAELRLWFED